MKAVSATFDGIAAAAAAAARSRERSQSQKERPTTSARTKRAGCTTGGGVAAAAAAAARSRETALRQGASTDGTTSMRGNSCGVGDFDLDDDVVPNPLRILAFSKGMEVGMEESLKRLAPRVRLTKLDTPEPLDDKSIEQGIEVTEEYLKSCGESIPHLLMGCSRGGKLVGEVLSRGLWSGPVLLCSAMGTAAVCDAASGSGDFPVLVLHGSEDGTNPLRRVREDVKMHGRAKLIVFEGEGHGLVSLNDSTKLVVQLNEVFGMQSEEVRSLEHDDELEMQHAKNRMRLFAELSLSK